MIRARVFISSALRCLKFFGRVSIFLFFGAMGMAFIQKGGGIFAELTIRSAADKLVTTSSSTNGPTTASSLEGSLMGTFRNKQSQAVLTRSACMRNPTPFALNV